MTTNKKIDIEALEQTIELSFKDKELLTLAFVHKSYVNENKDSKDNERLEFLGDAVLELATTRYLYDTCPNSQEGELTAFRSALVKGKHLASVAEELGLGDYLSLSHGEEKSGGREKKLRPAPLPKMEEIMEFIVAPSPIR